MCIVLNTDLQNESSTTSTTSNLCTHRSNSRGHLIYADFIGHQHARSGHYSRAWGSSARSVSIGIQCEGIGIARCYSELLGCSCGVGKLIGGS